VLVTVCRSRMVPPSQSDLLSSTQIKSKRASRSTRLSLIGSAVVARAAVEPNWDSRFPPARSGTGAHVSKRDQLWDEFRGAGSGLFGGLFWCLCDAFRKSNSHSYSPLSLFLLASLWGLIVGQIGPKPALCSYSCLFLALGDRFWASDSTNAYFESSAFQ
jgi:hypothetical protein